MPGLPDRDRSHYEWQLEAAAGPSEAQADSRTHLPPLELCSHAITTHEDVEAALSALLNPQTSPRCSGSAMDKLASALHDAELRSAAQLALCKVSCAQRGAELDVAARRTLLRALASIVATTPAGYDDRSIGEAQSLGAASHTATNTASPTKSVKHTSVGTSGQAAASNAGTADSASTLAAADCTLLPNEQAHAPTLQRWARVAICQWASMQACCPLPGSELPGSPDWPPASSSRDAEPPQHAAPTPDNDSQSAIAQMTVQRAQARAEKRRSLEAALTPLQLAALPSCVTDGSSDEIWQLTSTTVQVPCGMGLPSDAETALRAASTVLHEALPPGWPEEVPGGRAEDWALAALCAAKAAEDLQKAAHAAPDGSTAGGDAVAVVRSLLAASRWHNPLAKTAAHVALAGIAGTLQAAQAGPAVYGGSTEALQELADGMQPVLALFMRQTSCPATRAVGVRLVHAFSKVPECAQLAQSPEVTRGLMMCLNSLDNVAISAYTPAAFLASSLAPADAGAAAHCAPPAQ